MQINDNIAALDEGQIEAAIHIMDDDLREKLSSEGIADNDREFIAIYAERHAEKFGEEFAPAVGGAW